MMCGCRKENRSTLGRLAGWARLCLAIAAAGISVHANAEMQVSVEGVIELQARLVNGHRLSGLSGLAWDEDEQVLFAVSDKGKLFRFRLEMTERRPTAIVPIDATRLRDADGRAIDRADANAEALVALNADNGIAGDTELLIAFESSATLARFRPDGTIIAAVALPEALSRKENYSAPNDGIEAVALHRHYAVMTAPERPLLGEPRDLHTIYTTSGHRFRFPTARPQRSSIKALEVMPDDSVLILERSKEVGSEAMTAHLRRFEPTHCPELASCAIESLTVLPDELASVNLEGMTRVGDELYLLVSDASGKAERHTTFVLLRLFSS